MRPFLAFALFDCCRLEGDHVEGTHVALLARALPVLAEAEASPAALLASPVLPTVHTDAGTAALLAPPALPPVLTDPVAAALLAPAEPPAVRTRHLCGGTPTAAARRRAETARTAGAKKCAVHHVDNAARDDTVR